MSLGKGREVRVRKVSEGEERREREESAGKPRDVTHWRLRPSSPPGLSCHAGAGPGDGVASEAERSDAGLLGLCGAGVGSEDAAAARFNCWGL